MKIEADGSAVLICDGILCLSYQGVASRCPECPVEKIVANYEYRADEVTDALYDNVFNAMRIKRKILRISEGQ